MPKVRAISTFRIQEFAKLAGVTCTSIASGADSQLQLLLQNQSNYTPKASFSVDTARKGCDRQPQSKDTSPSFADHFHCLAHNKERSIKKPREEPLRHREPDLLPESTELQSIRTPQGDLVIKNF
jgi:hypothetical protein